MNRHPNQFPTETSDLSEAKASEVIELADGGEFELKIAPELPNRYALDGHQQTLERQTAVLTKLAAAAAS